MIREEEVEVIVMIIMIMMMIIIIMIMKMIAKEVEEGSLRADSLRLPPDSLATLVDVVTFNFIW